MENKEQITIDEEGLRIWANKNPKEWDELIHRIQEYNLQEARQNEPTIKDKIKQEIDKDYALSKKVVK